MAACKAALHQPEHFGIVPREDGLQRRVAQVARNQFVQDVAEVGGQRQVAALVELLFFEAGPEAIDPAAFDSAAHHEHAVGVPVIRAAIAVLPGGAPEFAHVTTTTSFMRSPMSFQKALNACPYSRSRLASTPSLGHGPSSLKIGRASCRERV